MANYNESPSYREAKTKIAQAVAGSFILLGLFLAVTAATLGFPVAGGVFLLASFVGYLVANVVVK